MNSKIPVYAINLKDRPDRLNHIQTQFNNRAEFSLHIVEAIKDDIGAIGLWLTIKHILSLDSIKEQEYIIICEDDHIFTNNYTKENLLISISLAKGKKADILLGGPSWISSSFQVKENLFWVEEFNGLQFTVIFNQFFDTILHSNSNFHNMGADFKISQLSQQKYFIYPYISIQKEFGYSDATHLNNTSGRVDKLFEQCAEKIQLNNTVKEFYDNYPSPKLTDIAFNNICIPTYIINLPERVERKLHIIKEFTGRKEFDITIVEACKNPIGALGLWLSIRKIIEVANKNEDDVILICEDDHEFTEAYTKEFLILNILEASEQGVDYLSGGSGGFSTALPITRNRFWVSSLLSTQFIIIYRKFFQRILDEPYNSDIIADLRLSEMTSNKMLLYPFISSQKDFGYSDVTAEHNINEGLVTRLFNKTQDRLRWIQQAYFGS